MLDEYYKSEITLKSYLYMPYVTYNSNKYSIVFVKPPLMDKFINKKIFIYSVPFSSTIYRKRYFISDEFMNNPSDATHILSLYTRKNKDHFCFRNIKNINPIKKDYSLYNKTDITLALMSTKKEIAKIKLLI